MRQVFFPRLAGMTLKASEATGGQRCDCARYRTRRRPTRKPTGAVEHGPASTSSAEMGTRHSMEPAVGRLGQHQLPLQDRRRPATSTNAATGKRLLGVMIHATYEERADRALGKPGGINGHLGAASRTGQWHAMNHFV